MTMFHLPLNTLTKQWVGGQKSTFYSVFLLMKMMKFGGEYQFDWPRILWSNLWNNFTTKDAPTGIINRFLTLFFDFPVNMDHQLHGNGQQCPSKSHLLYDACVHCWQHDPQPVLPSVLGSTSFWISLLWKQLVHAHPLAQFFLSLVWIHFILGSALSFNVICSHSCPPFEDVCEKCMPYCCGSKHWAFVIIRLSALDFTPLGACFFFVENAINFLIS